MVAICIALKLPAGTTFSVVKLTVYVAVAPGSYEVLEIDISESVPAKTFELKKSTNIPIKKNFIRENTVIKRE